MSFSEDINALEVRLNYHETQVTKASAAEILSACRRIISQFREMEITEIYRGVGECKRFIGTNYFLPAPVTAESIAREFVAKMFEEKGTEL